MQTALQPSYFQRVPGCLHSSALAPLSRLDVDSRQVLITESCRDVYTYFPKIVTPGKEPKVGNPGITTRIPVIAGALRGVTPGGTPALTYWPITSKGPDVRVP